NQSSFAAATSGRVGLLWREHDTGGGNHLPNRKQAAQESLGRLLFLVIPLLPHGCRNRRVDELLESCGRLADIDVDVADYLPYLSLLSTLFGQARVRKESRRADVESAPAHNRSTGPGD